MLPVEMRKHGAFATLFFPSVLGYVYRSCFIMASERNRTGAGPLIDPVFDYPVTLQVER